jgi:TonB family protein
MMLLSYAIKVVASSAILTGYYWLLLRNKKFHAYNRYFILLALLLPLCLPFLQIPVTTSTLQEKGDLLTTFRTISVTEFEETATVYFLQQPPRHWLTVSNSLFVLYAAGTTVFLFLLLRSIFYIRNISKKYPVEKIGDIRFYQTNEPAAPFSFFKKIFWNSRISLTDEKGGQIFNHEMYHVRHGHSFDIMLVEIITVFFWWNPFFYWLRKELKTVHEFLADQYAISHHDKFDYAALLVTQSLQTKTSALTHPFFHNALKRRIAMITKNQTSRFQYISKVLVLPLLALVITAFAIKKVNTATPLHSKELIAVVIDAGHGGTDPGASGADTSVTEAMLSLQITQQIKKLASEYGVQVVLTRENNQFPGNAITKEEGIIKRIDIATASHAALFISIHASAAPEQSTRSGFHAFTTARRTDENSNTLASILLQKLSSLYKTDPVIKQRNGEGIYVLDKAPCPAVLIECGYLTNTTDLAFISDSDNQEKIARKILTGIVSYASQKSITANSISPAPVSLLEPPVPFSANSDTLSYSDLKKIKSEEIEKIAVTKTIITVTLKNGETKLFRNEMPLKEQATIKKTNPVNQVFTDPAVLENLNPSDVAKITVNKKEFNTMTIHLKNGQVMVMDGNAVSEYYESRKHKDGLNISANAGSDTNSITLSEIFVERSPEKDASLSLGSSDKVATVENNRTFTETDIPAEFPGGNTTWIGYLLRSLRYPAEAIAKKIDGKVVVQFIVDVDGKISDVKAVEGPQELRSEAERVVREGGGWIPAIQNGKKVRAIKKQPIQFVLNSDKKTALLQRKLDDLNNMDEAHTKTIFDKLRSSEPE